MTVSPLGPKSVVVRCGMTPSLEVGVAEWQRIVRRIKECHWPSHRPQKKSGRQRRSTEPHQVRVHPSQAPTRSKPHDKCFALLGAAFGPTRFLPPQAPGNAGPGTENSPATTLGRCTLAFSSARRRWYQERMIGVRDPVLHSPAAFLASSSAEALCSSLWDSHSTTPDSDVGSVPPRSPRRRSVAPNATHNQIYLSNLRDAHTLDTLQATQGDRISLELHQVPGREPGGWEVPTPHSLSGTRTLLDRHFFRIPFLDQDTQCASCGQVLDGSAITPQSAHAQETGTADATRWPTSSTKLVRKQGSVLRERERERENRAPSTSPGHPNAPASSDPPTFGFPRKGYGPGSLGAVTSCLHQAAQNLDPTTTTTTESGRLRNTQADVPRHSQLLPPEWHPLHPSGVRWIDSARNWITWISNGSAPLHFALRVTSTLK